MALEIFGGEGGGLLDSGRIEGIIVFIALIFRLENTAGTSLLVLDLFPKKSIC